ncbi:Uncharacterised protein [Mycobacterium tuberculosis]|nr:Uncharacterised protein [Mycobacterium tuberculosis]
MAFLDPVTMADVAVTVGAMIPFMTPSTEGNTDMQKPITKGRKSG